MLEQNVLKRPAGRTQGCRTHRLGPVNANVNMGTIEQ